MASGSYRYIDIFGSVTSQGTRSVSGRGEHHQKSQPRIAFVYRVCELRRVSSSVLASAAKDTKRTLLGCWRSGGRRRLVAAFRSSSRIGEAFSVRAVMSCA